MAVLVVGASGATGRLVVKQLLEQGEKVKVIVRSTGKLADLLSYKQLKVIEASVLKLSDKEMKKHVKDCSAVVSCLGHNITIKGMYGHPRRLVTKAAQRLCKAIEANRPEQAIRYILMNTTGNRNPDANESISFAQQCVIGLLRLLLPPHVDNEKAADYLRIYIGQHNKYIEWVAVRPDALIDAEEVSEYEIHPSPIRSAIFNSGKTSRVNVAHFMTRLATTNEIWQKWKGQMPVIYNT